MNQLRWPGCGGGALNDTTGRLLRILSHTDQPLSALLADVPRYYATAETRIPCPDGEKFAVVARLVEHFRKDYDVIDADGWIRKGLTILPNKVKALLKEAEREATTPTSGGSLKESAGIYRSSNRLIVRPWRAVRTRYYPTVA